MDAWLEDWVEELMKNWKDEVVLWTWRAFYH